MIAANYRKFPEAMALQLVLVFGACVWHTGRPTTRAGRAIRAAVGRAFKAADKIVYPVKPTTPQWVRDLGRLVRKLGQSVKDAQICLDFMASNEIDKFAEMIDRVKRAILPFELDANTRRILANIPRQNAYRTKLQYYFDVLNYIHRKIGTNSDQGIGNLIKDHMHSWLMANEEWMRRDNVLERHRLGTLPGYMKRDLAELTGPEFFSLF